MRLVRKGQAILAGANKVGRGSTYDSDASGRPLRASYIVRNRTHVLCEDTFHNVFHKYACGLSCSAHGIKVPHFHEPAPGRILCPGSECINHKYDPTDEQDVLYSSPEGDEDPVYHNRLDLPRQHDAGKASRKLRRNLTRQAKSKR
jgi:hypothetical protein